MTRAGRDPSPEANLRDSSISCGSCWWGPASALKHTIRFAKAVRGPLRVGSVCCREGRFVTGAVVLKCWKRFALVR